MYKKLNNRKKSNQIKSKNILQIIDHRIHFTLQSSTANILGRNITWKSTTQQTFSHGVRTSTKNKRMTISSEKKNKGCMPNIRYLLIDLPFVEEQTSFVSHAQLCLESRDEHTDTQRKTNATCKCKIISKKEEGNPCKSTKRMRSTDITF